MNDEPPKILPLTLKESDNTPSNNMLGKNKLFVRWNEEIESILIYTSKDKHKKYIKNSSSI